MAEGSLPTKETFVTSLMPVGREETCSWVILAAGVNLVTLGGCYKEAAEERQGEKRADDFGEVWLHLNLLL